MRLESKRVYGDMVLPRMSCNQYYEAMYDATEFSTSVAYGPLFPQSPTDPKCCTGISKLCHIAQPEDRTDNNSGDSRSSHL